MKITKKKWKKGFLIIIPTAIVLGVIPPLLGLISASNNSNTINSETIFNTVDEFGSTYSDSNLADLTNSDEVEAYLLENFDKSYLDSEYLNNVTVDYNENSASVDGDKISFKITVTPNDGYTWEDGTTDSKEYDIEYYYNYDFSLGAFKYTDASYSSETNEDNQLIESGNWLTFSNLKITLSESESDLTISNNNLTYSYSNVSVFSNTYLTLNDIGNDIKITQNLNVDDATIAVNYLDENTINNLTITFDYNSNLFTIILPNSVFEFDNSNNTFTILDSYINETKVDEFDNTLSVSENSIFSTDKINGSYNENQHVAMSLSLLSNSNQNDSDSYYQNHNYFQDINSSTSASWDNGTNRVNTYIDLLNLKITYDLTTKDWIIANSSDDVNNDFSIDLFIQTNGYYDDELTDGYIQVEDNNLNGSNYYLAPAYHSDYDNIFFPIKGTYKFNFNYQTVSEPTKMNETDDDFEMFVYYAGFSNKINYFNSGFSFYYNKNETTSSSNSDWNDYWQENTDWTPNWSLSIAKHTNSDEETGNYYDVKIGESTTTTSFSFVTNQFIDELATFTFS